MVTIRLVQYGEWKQIAATTLFQYGEWKQIAAMLYVATTWKNNKPTSSWVGILPNWFTILFGMDV